MAYPSLLCGDELHGLLAIPCLRTEEYGGEAVERDALGTIDDIRREIFVA